MSQHINAAQLIHWLHAMSKTTSRPQQLPHRANHGSVSAPLGLKIWCLCTGVMPRLVLPNAGCAIITASRVAARRRHLAGCQTHWGPPSNSSHQNKGSVRNTDSCNISPGTGSQTISQNTCREIFLSLTILFGGYCLQSCCCWSNVRKQFSSVLLVRLI